MTETCAWDRQVYTEGVCDDGAAILRDGVPMTIPDILAALNAPCVPPAAPGADEVEVVVRAFAIRQAGADREPDPEEWWENCPEAYREAYRKDAHAALAALAELRAAERERAFRRGWKAGAEAMQDACLDAGDGVKTAMAMRMCIAEVPVPPPPAHGGGE